LLLIVFWGDRDWLLRLRLPESEDCITPTSDHIIHHNNSILSTKIKDFLPLIGIAVK
jgi:hypothetical protein